MGQKYLIDTNVVIGILKGAIPRQNLSKLSKIQVTEFIISTIVNIETLGFYAIPIDERRQAERFLSKATILYIDKEIEQKAIEIRQKKKMKLGDAIIAATALIHDLIIVTRNESDFYGLGLTIYNPFK